MPWHPEHLLPLSKRLSVPGGAFLCAWAVEAGVKIC